MPAEEATASASPQEETSAGGSSSNSSESQAEAPPTSKPSSTPAYAPKTTSSKEAQADTSKSSSERTTKSNYPLYPSVQHILRERGVSDEEASKIRATGPRGRLLKGDVLAHLGSIKSSYASDLSARVSKLGHLDLSNIKAAAPAKAAPSDQMTAPSPPSLTAPEVPKTVSLPISLDKVRHVQRRVERVLGVSLPLATFVSRAAEVANRDLPLSPGKSVLSDDALYDEILGLDKVSSTKTSRGHFTPQIAALPHHLPPPSIPNRPNADIYDLLTGGVEQSRRPSLPSSSPNLPQLSSYPYPTLSTTDLITVSVSHLEEQRRAQAFLGRVKTILELEPGRLLL